jgi:N-acyl homoserine lactone hydrolase
MARVKTFWKVTSALLVAAGMLELSHAAIAQSSPPTPATKKQPVRSPRLYVFDCGTLDVTDTGRFGLKREEVATDKFSVGCYLIVHPRGVLLWDAGAVPDGMVTSGGAPVRNRIVLPDGQERFATVTKSLKSQLAEVGYTAADVTHLALSHYHYDHSANANDFAGATWLVRQVERDAMFADKPPALTQPSSYAALRGSKINIITTDDHDVFGDGSVTIRFTPGHTPGHQVLYIKLVNTGGVVLSGDLYHFPEERTLGRIPTIEYNQQQTAASRAALDAFLKKSLAQLWIQHDFIATGRLKTGPNYYD